MIHNLYTFHGTDHKVGTTMTSQTVAETISAGHTNLKILLIAMNGRASAEYIREEPVSIDTMKFHIDNKMVSGEDFIKTCTHRANLYILAGAANEPEARFYHPEMAAYLLEEVAPVFDLIIADSGNELDNGLAIGALAVSEEVYLVMTQQESAIRRYEKNRPLMDELGVGISAYVVNKYFDQDPFGLSYIADRLEAGKEKFHKIISSGYSRQAEIDCRTLLEYKNEAYQKDIVDLANSILNKAGIAEIQRQRKSRWKSFI